MPDHDRLRVEVLVVGSGAGGATTALELASAGLDVVVLEEGERHGPASYGARAPEAMRRLYRRRGMTPILGRVPIGYVEGRCVGGSTEINSGFWHRTPPEVALRWRAQFDLQGVSPAELEPHFAWAEALLGVGPSVGSLPPSSEVFRRGTEAMGWSGHEVPRMAPGCRGTNACASGCPTGAKQGVGRSLVPRAEAAGARVIAGAAVRLLLAHKGRVVGALAELPREDGARRLVRIDADHVFVCAGPTETPALLRRSGVRRHVGDTLRIHPMLKVVARFREELNAHQSVLPLLQVAEFWPEITLGGAFFTVGHLALSLSENWPATHGLMRDYRAMATYYVAVRGTGTGSVRPSVLPDGGTTVRYDVSDEDVIHLSRGLARLASLLLAAGALEVYPAVHGLPAIRTDVAAVRWLDERLDRRALALTTVHAFSSCPTGERPDRCAADSYGRVRGFENLYVNDASALPDSPGVNPQGSVMALARRNALHFRDARGARGTA